MVGTPHWAILPWARYCRIDPLGLNQNARWTDLLLVTGLTGQLRKGQFSSHWSTDWCTLNTHRSYRDTVIRVPVRPGPGTRYHQVYPVHRVRPRAVIDIGDIDIWIKISCDIDIDTKIVDIDILELGVTPVLEMSSLTINILKSINYSETMCWSG